MLFRSRRGNGVWAWNVGQLLGRIEVFTGRRVVAITTGPGLDPPDAVKALFAGTVHEFIEVPNDPALREVASFEPLFSRVANDDPNQITFFGHAKGVTKDVGGGSAVFPWVSILYESCLDYLPLVESVLTDYAFAGSLRKLGRCFDSRGMGNWHYAGSFCWMRNCKVFGEHWRTIDPTWWGIEAWPSVHFGPDEAGLLFHEAQADRMEPYLWEYLTTTLQPEFARWKTLHARHRGR